MMLELIYVPFFQKNRLSLKEIKIERKINSGLSYSYNYHTPPPLSLRRIICLWGDGVDPF